MKPHWSINSCAFNCVAGYTWMEVFADPLRERATAVIVAHNHPSGNLQPSNDDRNITKRLRTAGDLLGIQVLDHLIFSDEAFHSMLEENEF